jgi:polyisoprenoid-binding protein YceI
MTRHLLAAAVLAATLVPAAPAAAQSPAQGWTIDRAHSQVTFRVRHMGVAWVNGEFKEFTGSFSFDTTNLAAAAAQLTIQTASIDTENERRDNHLRSPDFFAADSFPQITFQSRRVERGSGPGMYRLVGDLTIRGVTRPVTLDVEVGGMRVVQGREGRSVVAGFSLSGRVNRLDYGLRWNNIVEGVNVVADEVRIQVDVEARRPAA